MTKFTNEKCKQCKNMFSYDFVLNEPICKGVGVIITDKSNCERFEPIEENKSEVDNNESK